MALPLIQTGGGSTPSGSQNQVYATPNGSSGSASLRALVAADIPNLDASKITSGVLAGAQGGNPLITSPGYQILPWKRYITTTNYTTNSLAANAVWGMVVTIDEMITINTATLGVLVNTAGTTGSFYIGIYDLSGNRLVQLKFAIGNNTTGVVSATITSAGYVLVPGTYLYVWGSDISSANLTVTALETSPTGNHIIDMLNTNGGLVRCGFKTGVISAGALTASGITASTLTAGKPGSAAVCVVAA